MQSEVREILLEFQRSEITEHEIYKRLAQKT
ncbi:MAG: rubrerythrin family protein, partial [Candidatus Hydrothermota bacterium]